MVTVIGLTGSFGSGCTNIAKNFLPEYRYKRISLSTILEELYKEEHKAEPSPRRQKLQEYGDHIRETRGSDYLSKRAYELLQSEQDHKLWVIDSFRNPAEIRFLKNKIPNFYLIGIFAERKERWERVRDIYDDDYRLFEKDDERDANEPFDHGQKVQDCYLMSDITILNNDHIAPGNEADEILKKKLKRYIGYIHGTENFKPDDKEALMAMAYANSLRSSCEKRKVGAVIIDDYGHVFSSGYNEVPVGHITCGKRFGSCYRDFLKRDFSNDLGRIIEDPVIKGKVLQLVSKNYKNLDHCRAIHAEENAILNVARVGSSIALMDATIFSTTYPCMLCANKIVQVGITNVVYVEPYPMKEAKEIFDKYRIKQEPFEGVLFNGYFRFPRGDL